MAASSKPCIAVFAGPTATVLNSAPLVTSNLARGRHGLPLQTDSWGRPLQFDVLRPQRLAKAVTVYVEQFSAHPLERDAAHLYGEPDGYLDARGEFHKEQHSDEDVAVYEVVLNPADGLIPLPYMALQRDGTPWEGDCAQPGNDPMGCRQPFYPDASRVFEEIDRLGVDHDGKGNQLGAQAEFDFIRVLPSAGFTKGASADERTDLGQGDIAPERIWQDFFPYRPAHLRREPPRDRLAVVANAIQQSLATGTYRGGIWLEGSPFIEETTYWLNLLVDAPVPVVGCASPDWPHGALAASGDRNLVAAVRYICSGVWADSARCDRVGVVVIAGDQIFAARDVQKGDSRPGGYVATGGHGGIVGAVGSTPVLTYTSTRHHTYRSAVRLSELPSEVNGVRRSTGDNLESCGVSVKDAAGKLLGSAVPQVTIVKHTRYHSPDAAATSDNEVEITARIEKNLAEEPLAGFVVEGSSPYGASGQSLDVALRRASLCGMPVVRVGRGNPDGFVPRERMKLCVAGSNLTATKARLLLMACLLRFGSLPPPVDPDQPTTDEVAAIEQKLERYQAVFDTH